MKKYEIETPAPLLDRVRMERNIRRMVDVSRRAGLRLRPHIKTHKCPAIAKIQIGLGAKGICVAKLGEAEVMAGAGLDDILVAYPIVGKKKTARFLDLNERIETACTTDSFEVAAGLSAAAKERSQTIRILVEVDSGLHRVGLPPGEPVLELVRRIIDLPGIHFAGLLTHGGMARHVERLDELPAMAHRESEVCLSTAELLRNNGFPVEEISVGSTPLARFGGAPGVTELRPGTFVFYDVSMVSLGAASFEDCAYTVLTTVVSRHPERLVVDAGSKTLSNDRPSGQLYASGLGVVVDHPHLRMDRLSEEHGVLTIKGPGPLPAIGDKLEIIPNHVCQSVNLHETLYVLEEGKVADHWRVEGRGKTV